MISRIFHAKNNYITDFRFLLYRTIDVYAANQSTIYITKPDLWQDPDEIIEYTIDNSNTEIEASCTAYGGNPKPEFHW